MDKEASPPAASQDATALYTQVANRHKDFKDKWVGPGQKIQEMYQGDKCDDTPFNILYSNTEVLVPSIFSKAPIPVVKRRHDETRADVPAKASERFLSYVMDTNLAGYPAFVDALESAILDAALPGLGQFRVRLVNQLPQLDYVSYENFIWGYAKRWERVPWIAYGHDMTKTDIETQFKLSEEAKAKFKGESVADDGSDESSKDATYKVYEVWDRRTKKVRFVCDAYEGCLLQESDDPLRLEGFYDCPQPLVFVLSTGDLKPRPLYNLYKAQAEELNRLTGRIKRVTEAIKVRGIYNGTLPEMANVLGQGQEENMLIPASKPSVMANEGGLDRQIWIMPFEKLVVTLAALQEARERVKSTIYEILGIGDILRGTSKASETLGAQQIKDKWGSLRINKMREKTARFVRSGLRLLLEVGAKHSPEEIWAPATGLELPSAVQVLVLQQSRQQPPKDSWPSVLKTLQDDMQRSYIIDIETNSTVDSEATQDKQDIAEFMTAMGQALTGLQPLAQQGPEGFIAAKAIMTEFIKKFRMGPEIQRILEQMQPPPTPQIPPEIQEQMQKKQQELDQREQQVGQQEKSLQQQTQSLKDLLAKIESKGQEVQLAQKQLESAMKTAGKELDLEAKEADLALREKAMGITAEKVALTGERAAFQGEKSQLGNEKAAVDQQKQTVAVEGKMLNQKATQVAGQESGLAELKPLLETLIKATEKNLAMTEELLTTAKSRGKAKFTQNEDGSVLKEYLQ